MNRQTDHDVDALDRALDAFALGDVTALDGLDRETRTTLDHLFTWAALGDPPGFDGGALASLAPTVHTRPAPITLDTRRSPIPMTATTTVPAPAPSVPNARRRIAPAIWSALAWTLIAALAGASIYGALPSLREGGPGNPTMTAYQPGAATPEAADETGEVNYGGDAGRSWHLGEIQPATGEPQILGAGPGNQASGSPLIVGDSVFYPAFVEEELHYVRRDLVSDETIWESKIAIIGSAASDRHRLFGFVMRNPGTDASLPVPVAISVETGELVWEGPPLVLGSDASAAGPVLFEDLVYFSDALGNTVALDADSGTVAWQYPDDFAPRTTYSDGDEFIGDPPDADMVVNGHGVFVERPSKTIVKLDPDTGEELGSFNLVDDFGVDIQQVSMQATADRLVISATRSERSPLGAGAHPPYRPTSVLIFDSATLNLVARGDLADLYSALVVTRDWIYLAGSLEAGGPIWIYRMNPADATFGDPFSAFEAPGPARLGLSLAGSTLMIVGPPDSVAQIDVEREAVIQSSRVSLAGGDSLTDAPMQLWRDTPIMVSTNGAVVVIGDG